MDIVSRLKQFMEYIAVPVTKFADNCNISRPTMTLLLKGRNEKVSHKLISKIHDAYPQLSVMWLMFGEGEMLMDENIKTSEPQNSSIFDFEKNETSESEEITPRIDFEESITESLPNKLFSDSEELNRSTASKIEEKKQISTEDKTTSGTISFNPDLKKQIVNIIVYYDDNSFESFIPGISSTQK